MRAATPLITPKRNYSEPEIGMDYLDFRQLCGSSAEHDSLETSRGTVIRDRYNTDKNNCFGTFTFVNYSLESIYR